MGHWFDHLLPDALRNTTAVGFPFSQQDLLQNPVLIKMLTAEKPCEPTTIHHYRETNSSVSR
jgi:hypothetical protein